MNELKHFFAYELENNGEKREIDLSEDKLAKILRPEQVLVLVREDLRRIFIWKGAKSSVKKRFISFSAARILQKELMEDPHFHICKIISVDQGDEVQEFLDAFNIESMEVIERLADMKYVRNRDRGDISKEELFPKEREHRINQHLVLKLIKGKTEIYIDEEPFHQCKYLLLNLTQKDFTKFEYIDSIDEAFEIYNKMEKNHEREHNIIDPESEFIDHCSNLQAWYEYDYDLRILHSSLSIPLLKKLAFLGDKKAIIRLKESIATRIASKHYNSIIFYLNEKYLGLFSNEELEVIFEDWLDKKVNFAPMEKRRLWYPLLKELIERGISKAREIIKKDIIFYLKENNFEAYRYLLRKDFSQLLTLKDLEDVYDLIPIKDKVALRNVERLILNINLRKRRDTKEKH
ncbi:MAG: hypothetical protein JXA99_08655 [Candidatus Lokiarchaeota archaeon]|nr:hypothetical protein [Candidatus Lokiarchaeota archaeon]